MQTWAEWARRGRLRPSRRAVGRVMVGVVLGLVAVGAPGVGAAQAHDQIVSTNPKDGAVLTVWPRQVEVVFAEKALSLGTAMRVTGPGGVVSTGPVQIAGTKISQALLPNGPAGTYRVLWRVTSEDGHPVSGQFSFVMKAAPGASSTATSSTATTAAASPSATVGAATTAPGSTGSGSAAPGSTVSATDRQSSGRSWWWVALGVGVVLAGVLIGVVVYRRRGAPAGH